MLKNAFMFVFAINLLASQGCKKVGLEEQFGIFSLLTSYWFENENVVYVFFEVDEAPERLINPGWELDYRVTPPVSDASKIFFIDFEAGVHEHRIVECGGSKTCGSFSFRSDAPLDELQLRMYYDKDSPLNLEMFSEHRNVFFEGTEDSYSALPYGVFDEENEKLRVELFHNFGTPRHDDMDRFGFKRKFTVHEEALFDITNDEHATFVAEKGDFLFPASFCEGASLNGVAAEIYDTDSEVWLAANHDVDNLARGACFDISLLDREENEMLRAFAYGRRNPVLKSSSFKLKTPVESAHQIPMVLHYCEGTPYADSVMDADFLNYQKYILGMEGREVDVCFEVGKEDEFRAELAAHLNARVDTAKSEFSYDVNDYIFVVLFHENLSKEFRKFHKIIAEELYRITEAESSNVSPRLVGAFVYASNVDFVPTLLQTSRLLWCPQELAPETVAASSLAAQNCTILPTGKLDLAIINFVAPLGPFPSLQKYNEYIEKYGDKGLARSPALFIDSPTHTSVTRTEKGKSITFFENQKISLTEDERTHVCYDREGALEILPYLRFRSSTISTEDSDSLDILGVEELWSSDDPAADYSVGLRWEFPFLGGIRYKGRLTGTVASIAPFQKSFRQYEKLGDEIWEAEEWDLGKYLQNCLRYCEHPFFDETGIYQIQKSWNDLNSNRCVDSKYPSPPGGG